MTFEEIPVAIGGAQFFAAFDVDLTYTTAGHMHRARVEEWDLHTSITVLSLTGGDGERVDDA